jgi:Protein of unknown function (DUF3071)
VIRLTVVGRTDDGLALVVRAGDVTYELSLDDVRAAEQGPAPETPGTPPPPREIQERIRRGESAAAIAREAQVPLAVVARYEGPVLAEREHQAQQVQRAEVDGRAVGELVTEHLARGGEPDDVAWDCWLTGDGRWEARASVGSQAVRLAWDARARRVTALDEPARRALRPRGNAEDVLEAVLRPVATRGPGEPAADTWAEAEAPGPADADETEAPPAAASGDAETTTDTDTEVVAKAEEPPPAPTRRSPARKRATLPGWEQISISVTGAPSTPAPDRDGP